MKYFLACCGLVMALVLACANSVWGQSSRAMVVVIDAGHGGRDSGAVVSGGHGRVMEKRITLAIAKRVAAELRGRGVDVVMTRTSDRYVGLEERAAKANAYRAALFVSIHCDSNPDKSQRGFSILMEGSGSSANAQMARMISAAMLGQGLRGHNGSGVRRDDRGLLVLRRATGPAVLVETGFLTNRAEGLQLAQAGQEERTAHGIAEGILRYLRR